MACPDPGQGATTLYQERRLSQSTGKEKPDAKAKWLLVDELDSEVRDAESAPSAHSLTAPSAMGREVTLVDWIYDEVVRHIRVKGSAVEVVWLEYKMIELLDDILDFWKGVRRSSR